MTNSPTTDSFEVVRRGYEPSQVDRHVAALKRELENHRHRADEAERRVQELHTQQPDDQAPAYAGLGARIEQILGLADEEARHAKAEAAEQAAQHRALTEQDAAKIRKDAERYGQERRADADTEAQRILQEAKRAADTLRDESERDAKARREEAEALFENNRAKAAQSAADFETTLAHRRDQAERDFTEKMKANQQQLAVVSHRSEQLHLEAEKLRADSDRKAKRTLEEAARQADDLIAEAKATAERIRTESERELTAATQRRDSINAQLTNVRQMLATLTGASLPDPIGDEPAATPEVAEVKPAEAGSQSPKPGQPVTDAKPDPKTEVKGAAATETPPSNVTSPEDTSGGQATAPTSVSTEKPSPAKR
jgi:cell division septum initiation protein DivIVA